MNYWVITDTHFGYNKMVEYCHRPYHFSEIILLNIGRVVKEGDILIHLGDVCLYKDAFWNTSFMSVCKGKRWLIRGNHDSKSVAWYISHGWDFVADEMVLNMFGLEILFTHRPAIDLKGHGLNIHGHWHNTSHHAKCLTSPKHQLIFIEHQYKPIKLKDIVSDWQRRKKERKASFLLDDLIKSAADKVAEMAVKDVVSGKVGIVIPEMFRAKIAKLFAIDISEVLPESRFQEDLAADSLDFVELILDAEEIYGISISDDEAWKIKTVQDAIDLINRLWKEKMAKTEKDIPSEIFLNNEKQI